MLGNSIHYVGGVRYQSFFFALSSLETDIYQRETCASST